MLLLDPERHDRWNPDDRWRDITRQTIAWVEERGLMRIQQADRTRRRCAALGARGLRLNTPPRPSGDGSRLCAACPSIFHFAP